MVIAILFRFWHLDIKPPHFDEGINGHFVLQIWRDGFYDYNPTNFHGPLYFYVLHTAEILLGRAIESFRVVNALLAVVLVWLIFDFRRYVGRTAIAAAALIAVSPAFTFYGRYAIHETLYILGQVIFAYGRLGWLTMPNRKSLYMIAGGIVILASTKETFFVFLGTWAIAELSLQLLEKIEFGSVRAWEGWRSLPMSERTQWWKEIGLTVLVSIAALAALYTGFGAKPTGAFDFFRAFDVWSQTGNKGNGHEKPFVYWFQQLFRYEWWMLVGLVLAFISLFWLRKSKELDDRYRRLLLLVGFGQFWAYSIIPYKTPWLILSFWSLAFWWFPNKRYFFPALALLVGLFGQATLGALDLNFVNFVNPKESYVYVQTTMDYKTVFGVLKSKAEKNPEVRPSLILIMVRDPWPMPYDISLFPRARYVKPDDLAREPELLQRASLVLIDGEALEGLKRAIPKKFARMSFHLRDAYNPGWALFDFALFQDVLPADVPVETPVAAAEVKAEMKTDVKPNVKGANGAK